MHTKNHETCFLINKPLLFFIFIRLLSENPSLLQLYKELVMTQIITPEEFWKNHAAQYMQKQQQANQQHVGVSGAFLV